MSRGAGPGSKPCGAASRGIASNRIATYQIPPIGTNLVVHVSLPGGYEFEAQAIVRWTREAPNSGPSGQEAPPGFGAQFMNISPEGRQLVYRYVRNREPLFHDDL